MNGLIAVYLREMLILKRKLIRQLSSMTVGPLLYLVAFGYAMGGGMIIEGRPYLEFLIPGLIAMNGMNQAFGIATEINVARFYWFIFEEFQSSPISNAAYVAGEVLAGMTRAMIGVLVVICLCLPFGLSLQFNIWFWLAVLCNSFVFASLAVTMAMLVKSHADQSLVTSFVITPMAFLGGTFFPLETLPLWAQKVLYFLPLTHASKAIRSSAFGQMPDMLNYLVMLAVGALFFWIALNSVNKARD